MTETLFAYGDNRCDGEKCPALQAGLHTRGPMGIMAAKYDREAQDRQYTRRNQRGTIMEDQAKRYWLAVLERLANRTEEVPEFNSREKIVNEGREVAIYMDWIDPDDPTYILQENKAE